MAAEQESSKKVHHVEVKNCKYVFIGDGTIFTPSEDDVSNTKDAIETLTTLCILPGKPFHKCYLRTDELQKIMSWYNEMSNSEDKMCVSTVYLTGPPGSGKTQIARQFGEQFSKKIPSYKNYRPLVLTLNTDSVESLLQSTKNVLDKLGLTKGLEIPKDDNETNLVRLYVGELGKVLKKYPGKWLLILDNMFRDVEINILPKPGSEDWGEGNILVTSQDSDLVPACHEFARHYSLGSGMDKSAALDLLRNVSGISTDEFAVELAEELEFFPLSLACAATYVGQMIADRPSSGFSWKHFLALYREKREALTYRTYAAFNVYPHSMAVAARLAVKRLAECSDVLRHTFHFLSYCTLSPVPLILVSNFVQARLTSKDIPFEEIQAEISRCSLLLNVLSGFQSVETIKFHQVIGEAFKYLREEPGCIENLDEEATRKNYVFVLKSLNESLKASIPNYDSRSVAVKVLVSPHLKSFISYGKSKEWNVSAEFVVALSYLGDSLYHVPGITEAERIACLELAREISGNLPQPITNISYCQILKGLGFYYREADQLDKSVVVLKQALALTENQYDAAWLALKSSILNVLSWTYKLQMKLDVAEQTMRESIEILNQAGDRQEQIVERLCNLAIIYREKCEMERAKETADEARELAETTTDEWHLSRAQAANYSAKIYLRCAEMNDDLAQKQELLIASRNLHAEALNIYENVLGQNHIYVAGVCMTYAVVNKELKACNVALEQVERAVKIYSDVEHTVLNSALCYKTEVLLAVGNASKEAEQTIKRSIELSNCARARFLLAQVYLQQKRFKEARDIFKEVLTRWNSGILPATHVWVKLAQKLKAECDRGILKQYLPIIVMVVVVLVSVLLGYWLNS